MEKLKIKNFTSYRSFLLAYVHECKQRRSNWSLGMFAKQLGLKDTSSITKILNGAREPGPSITAQLIRYFAFNESEELYFKNLLRLEKIKDDPKLTSLILERLGKTFTDDSVRILNDASFQMICEWHHLAIREMVKLKDFQENSRWIAKRLRFEVTPEEVARSIQLLIQVGLLKRKYGKLVIDHGRFHIGDTLKNEAIQRYHETLLGLAKRAIQEVEMEKREFSSTVFTMDIHQIPKAKEMIREFKSRFAKLMEEPRGNLTVQLQLQFFPVTYEVETSQK